VSALSQSGTNYTVTFLAALSSTTTLMTGIGSGGTTVAISAP
jgi:hypothetical protein